MHALRPGADFAGYRIERVLGVGGMGSVYAARHPRLPRLVALKLLHSSFAEDPVFRGRFEREAELAGRLDHPNIVTIHDRGREGSQLWISMQYVEGTDAETAMRAGQMPPLRALFVAAATAGALDYAHRQGMLHRDVKPANILIRSEPNSQERVLLTDFGIAKARDEATSLTQTGTLLATLRYASPEQLEGKPLDPRSDQYSLGCTLFHLLAGQPPYPAESAAALISAHLVQPVPRISAVRPDLPPALDDVFARALAKEPQQRFGSCVAMVEAARRAFTEPAPVPPPPQRRRRWRWPVAVVALVAVTAAVTATVVAARSGDEVATGPTTTLAGPPATPTTVPPTTTPPDPWALGRETVALFPDLLPSGPDSSGFRELRCSFATKNPNAVWTYGFNCLDANKLELQVLTHDDSATVDSYIATLPAGATERLRSRYGQPLIVRQFTGSTGPWVLVQFAEGPRAGITFQVFWKDRTHQEVIDEWVRTAPF
ncbi:serine/threonine-protein kinase [Nocardia cyriacigeorgica]|uniref:serine/threonine-protein kinase n=1 Tax=Nocardia cyriacigeorgica TaxID=135487 RepID=UPI0018947FDD|nr:serine/threonine-protein kinase [Nocardia cyriacigeorgica]MBF6452320.1 serine/threonine protein kinase [Nocardia cyriacigeorgica]MBF6478979.1 serine/threonine protein kinase [Nocardia cyriacigeorgica]MBF6549489.1 serine/threonine protein kinase [Nocardia cyriacigeorgica]